MRALLLSGNFISLQRLSSTGKPDDSNLRETLKTGPVCAGSQGRLDKHIQKEGVHKHNLNAAEAQGGHSFIITDSQIQLLLDYLVDLLGVLCKVSPEQTLRTTHPDTV